MDNKQTEEIPKLDPVITTEVPDTTTSAPTDTTVTDKKGGCGSFNLSYLAGMMLICIISCAAVILKKKN